MSKEDSENTNREVVRLANLNFYESTANHYDFVDRRRSSEREHLWLDYLLSEIRGRISSSPATFLDLGAGTGFLAKKATRLFEHVLAVDQSPAMLAKIEDPKIQKILGTCEELPVEASSIDVVGAFATLHHLHDPRDAFREAYRVLKPGGILYTDHDIEASFVSRFRSPLLFYRYFFDHGHDYLKHAPHLTAEDYKLTELHGDRGLESEVLEQSLRDLGYRKIEFTFHWQGLLPITFPWKRKGWSPLVRILATK